MLTLPDNLTPSLLIPRDKLSLEASRLFNECNRIRLERLCGQTEQVERDLEDLRRTNSDQIGYATALLRLADVCREMGKLGPAQRYCRRAREVFSQSGIAAQGFSESMATYALGLVHQFLGDEKEACDHFQQTRELLRQVRGRFRIIGDVTRADECDRISSWIEKLVEYVTDVRLRGETTAFPCAVLVCSWPSTADQAECLPVELKIEKYVATHDARIAGDSFGLHPINDSVTLEPGKEYRVVKASEQGMPDASLEKADYALIEKGKSSEDIGVIRDEHGEILFGRFERRPDGSVHFISTENKPARIIGDPDAPLASAIIGSLKPTGMTDRRLLVLGLSAIDITGRQADKPGLPGTPNLGDIHLSVGGAARNIAESLARLGRPPVLLSAVGDDKNGRYVLNQTAASGVNIEHVLQSPDYATSAHLAILDDSGVPMASISDMEIMDVLTSSYLYDHHRCFEEAEWLILDADLTPDVLRTAFELAHRYGLRVCADPTSVALAERLIPYLRDLYLVTPNPAEAEVLCGRPVNAHRQGAIAAAKGLVAQGVNIAVITLSELGACYATSDVSGYVPALRYKAVDLASAGEAMTAGIVFGLLEGLPIHEAVRLGTWLQRP